MDMTVTRIGAVVVAELRAAGYLESTIGQYAKTIRALAEYAGQRGGVYTPGLGAEFASMTISPRTETALELMKHRLREVRGRAILDCLAHAKEPWAQAALEKGAPHALAYRVDD